MARYRGPKNKLARREGTDLGLKTPGSSAHAQLLRRLKIVPGQKTTKSRRKITDYGTQLREKQKVKRIYGLLERQFRKNFEIALREKGNTGAALVILLERRLDNVLYRLHLAPTRTAARQYITHNHILVNGKRASIPSMLVKADMVITPKTKILETPVLKKLLEDKDVLLPAWLERKGPAGRVKQLPTREDVTENIDEQLIIEFYSR